MNATRIGRKWELTTRRFLGAALWAALSAGAVQAQTSPAAPATPVLPAAPAAEVKNAVATSDLPGGVQQTGCASCSGGLLGSQFADLGGPGGCVDGGCCGYCYPGHKPCDCCCNPDSGFGRFLCGFYQCVCCPDPCYEPHWVAAADADFFTEGARPVTQMRLRYDEVWSVPQPDKGEFLIARQGQGQKGPPVVANNLHYREATWYNEVANNRFSASVELPIRQITSDVFSNSGFGDIVIGTKSLLLDCELMQITFGFKTFVPTGNEAKGLGTGHVSLEPQLLGALKLAPKTYLQSELAYRFPLGGTSGFEGPVFHYHLGLNHVLWCCGHDVQLIGTLELNGYEFLGGEFSDQVGGAVVLGRARDAGNVLNAGPGVRLVLCDTIDFGVGSAFKLTSDSIGDEILRVEFRWRF